MVQGREAPIGLKVLILEDRPDDAELILYELRSAGYQPAWKRVDTEESYLDSIGDGLDVILADFNLPQFNALRALQLLNQRRLDIPFIIVSGVISEETAIDCMKLGAADYLLKDRLGTMPEMPEEILKRVANDRNSPDFNSAQLEGKYFFAPTAAGVAPAFQGIQNEILRLSK